MRKLEFAKLIVEAKIDAKSRFEEIAQLAVNCYYLPPYPGQKDLHPHNVNRKHHGGLHACSTAMNMEMQIAFYRKHFPHLLVSPDGTPLDEETIKLLKLACIYHDSANTREVFHNELLQALKFEQDMLLLEFNPEKVKNIAKALAEKDSKEISTNIHHDLIHDSDCLDILRMIDKAKFRRNELKILKHCKGIPEALAELNEIISNHSETYQIILKKNSGESISQTHLNCEFSENCFLSLKQIETNILQYLIVAECLEKGKIITTSQIEDLNILDIYNRKSKKVKSLIDRLTKQADEKKQIISIDLKEPYLIRGLKKVESEFEQLYKNNFALQDEKITNSEELKEYVETHPSCPTGFQWRPCTLVIPSVPIRLFNNDILRVIIDLKSKTTLCSYFYKKVAYSSKIKSDTFVYNPKNGGCKNKLSLDKLKSKIIEQNERRQGIM